MSPSLNLRVVVACVTFETAMVVKPIEFYKADRVYLLHYASKAPYDAFLCEVERQLEPLIQDCKNVKVNINNFKDVLRTILDIIRKEKAQGNHVYINVSAGPNVFGAAALIACGMEGAIPFNVGVKEYTVKDTGVYCIDGKPVGLAKDVYDPHPLPEFEIKAPRIELVKGLAVLDKIKTQKGSMSASNVIRRLGREGLMSDFTDGREKVTQGAVMKYRRNYLDQWVKNGWALKKGRELEITELGRSMLEIFG